MERMKRWISALLAVVLLIGAMPPVYGTAAETEDVAALTETTAPTETTETEPEITEFEITEPEVTEPVVTEPEVTEPVVTEHEVTEPEVTEPEVTEPKVTEPEVTEPEVTEPEVTEPEVTEPEVTEPEMTEPETTEPEVTEHETTEPEVTEPEVVATEPEAAAQGTTEPGETLPETTEETLESIVATEEVADAYKTAYGLEELRDALNTAKSGDTIYSMGFIELEEDDTLTIPKGVTVFAYPDTEGDYSGAAIYMYSGSTLTIRGTLKMAGELYSEGKINLYGTLDMQGCYLEAHGYLINEGTLIFNEDFTEADVGWYLDWQGIREENRPEWGQPISENFLLSGQTVKAQLRLNIDLYKTSVPADAYIRLAEGSEEWATLTYKNGIATITAKTVSERKQICLDCFIPEESWFDYVDEWQASIQICPVAKKLDIVRLDGDSYPYTYTYITGKTETYNVVEDISAQISRYHYQVYPEDALVDIGFISSNTGMIDNQWCYLPDTTTADSAVLKVHDSISGVSASTTVQVVDAQLGFIWTEESDARYYIPGGKTKTLQVGLYDADGLVRVLSNSELEWSAGIERDGMIQYSPLVSIDAKGKLTTKAVKEETEIHVRARYKNDDRDNQYIQETLYITPTVSNLHITGSSLAEGSLNGQTIRLNADDWIGNSCSLRFGFDVPPYKMTDNDTKPEYGTEPCWEYNPDWMRYLKSVSWSYSAPGVAWVDAYGELRIMAAGKSTITLTAVTKYGKTLTASFTLQVGSYVTEISVLTPDGPDTLYQNYTSSYDLNGGESILFENAKVSLMKSSDKSYVTIKNGNVKTKAIKSFRTVWLKVQSKDGNVTAQVELRIEPARNTLLIECGLPYPVNSGSITLPSKSEYSLYTTVENGDDVGVKWKSDKSSVVSVDSEGNLTAKKAGTAVITATATDGSKRKATITVKVTKEIEEMWIQAPAGNTDNFWMSSGKSMKLVAKVRYTDGSVGKASVNWHVEGEGGVPTKLASINSSGKFTAAKGLKARNVVYVTATLKSDASWRVEDQAINLAPLSTGVDIFGENWSGTINGTTKTVNVTDRPCLQLSAKVYPHADLAEEKAALEGVVWSSSNNRIARVYPDGFVEFYNPGTVTITAKAADNSGKKASFKLKITRATQYIDLQNQLRWDSGIWDYRYSSVVGGKSLTLKPVLYHYRDIHTDDNGVEYLATIKATNQKVKWSLDRNSDGYPFATINSKGVLKTSKVSTKKTVTVIATAVDNPECTQSFDIEIYPSAVSKVVLQKDGETLGKSLTMYVGDYGELTALISPGEGKCLDLVSWKSSKSSVVWVDPYSGYIECRKPGKITITVTARDGSKQKDTVTITVKKPPVEY